MSLYCFWFFSTGRFWSYRINDQHNRRMCYVGATNEPQPFFFESSFHLAAEAGVETAEQSKCNIFGSHLGPHSVIRPPTAPHHVFG